MRMFTSTLLVAAALLVATAGSAPAAEPQAPDRELSVAGYNIHHAAGVDDRLDLERIAGEIERGGADVIGLQEVDRHWSSRSEFADQAGWLAERLGMHVTYGANLDLEPLEPGQPRRQYGTAVLSEFPILWSRNTPLPRPGGGEQRGLLEAVLNVRGVRVRFANTHLQHDSAEERLAQAQRIAELLGEAEEPTVLVGDLNARPEAPELAPLWPHLVDAWTRAGEGAGNTYPAEAPDRRIDYVLVTPDVGVRSAEVLASPASDHLQVTAELAVPGTRMGGGRPATAVAAEPSLEGRALLAPDATAAAPFDGAPDAEPAPAPGATQPLGGFSALLDAPGRDTYWAMPDNGFGSKANSRSFLLRVYRVRAEFETAGGGSGDVRVLDWITLRDPDRRVPFEIVNGGTRERLLTGGDFDIESMRVDGEGDLWFGEEFGPFLLHTDATGKVLEAPIPLPGVKSPDYPPDAPAPVAGAANLGRSSGFEGMAISKDRRTLYPVLEGAVAADDPHVRRVYAFDLRDRRYTGREPDYRVADPSYLVSDFTALDQHRFVALERDNAEGAAARHKRGFVVDRRRGAPAKREVVDLLDLADPDLISLPGRPGDIGLGNPFSMPYVTIESVLPVGGDRLAIVNDTNFGSTGRNPELSDPSDFVIVRVPGLRGDPGRAAAAGSKAPLTLAVIGDTPYGDEQVAAFPGLVEDINADPMVRGVLHVGDIKNGSSTCTTERFRDLRALYDSFRDPFVYTPGDNEWTDCHRPAAGGYLPTERLDALREVFFPRPGVTTGGRPQRVRTQASDAEHAEYVENVRWTRSQVTFATVHVVGSSNDLQPWFGVAETPDQRAERLAEFERRQAADLDWLDATFAEAAAKGARGVVVAMQADTIVGTRAGFEAINERIETLASRFGGPVLLLQGDTHRYLVDRPFAAAPNLTRIVVEGETADEWLRLGVDPRAPGLFSWTREAVVR